MTAVLFSNVYTEFSIPLTFMNRRCARTERESWQFVSPMPFRPHLSHGNSGSPIFRLDYPTLQKSTPAFGYHVDYNALLRETYTPQQREDMK